MQAALARARKTLRHLDWFEVKEIRGTIGEAGVKEYQVVLEVGFRLEET
nr:dodecin domain-containing protein [Thermus thermophilus]